MLIGHGGTLTIGGKEYQVQGPIHFDAATPGEDYTALAAWQGGEVTMRVEWVYSGLSKFFDWLRFLSFIGIRRRPYTAAFSLN